MSEKTEKQIITKEFNPALQNKPAVNFDVTRFDSAVFKHGYRCYHSKSLRCPCVNKGTGSALPNCENCRGIGWFYVNKTLTKALMQNMGNKQEYDSWTEKIAGTVTITTLFDDDVSYLDKFEIIDLEANFSQILQPQNFESNLFAFTIYEPLKIMDIFMFVSSNVPLVPLYSKIEKPNNWDYELVGNKIIFNLDKYEEDYNNNDLSVSVRYKHTPVYHVIDIQRELFKARDQSECVIPACDGKNDLALRGVPQRSIGKRAHYLWDANNFNTLSIFDNTVYKK